MMEIFLYGVILLVLAMLFLLIVSIFVRFWKEIVSLAVIALILGIIGKIVL
jgi:hypothetical protein